MNEISVSLLIETALEEMARSGSSADHVRRYRKTGFGEIQLHFLQIGQNEYSSELIDEFVKQTRCEYETGNASRWKWGMVRRGAELLKQFHDNDTLELKRNRPWTTRKLSGYFSETVEQYYLRVCSTGNLRESTAQQAKYYARQLLIEFEDIGLRTFEKITPRIVNECVTRVAERYVGGATSLLVGLRRFLRYLHSNDITTADLSKSLPDLVAPRRPIRFGFSDDVTDSLLAAADISTVIGKRDYAIMMLASRTGLRGCDVVSLKRKDIDWHTKEVRIAQSKTGVPLTLPLPIDAGNAIADYLLNARPECDEPYIFLTTDLPYRRLKRAIGIVQKHIKRADVYDKVADRSGLHSFRRALGKTLLQSETPLDMLSELFGHTDMDSIKPYLAIEENGLKQCALGIAFVTDGGELV